MRPPEGRTLKSMMRPPRANAIAACAPSCRVVPISRYKGDAATHQRSRCPKQNVTRLSSSPCAALSCDLARQVNEFHDRPETAYSFLCALLGFNRDLVPTMYI